MNAQRRKTLADIATRAEALLAVALLSFDELVKVQPMLETMVGEVEAVQEDEEEAFDNMPEGLQNNKQDAYDAFVENAEAAIDALNKLVALEVCDYDEVEEEFENLTNALNDAQD